MGCFCGKKLLGKKPPPFLCLWWLFFILLILGILVFIHNWVFLPITSLIDSRLYLSWAQQIAAGQMPNPSNDISFPLQPRLVAGLLQFFNLPDLLVVKFYCLAVAFLTFFVLLWLCFFVLKKYKFLPLLVCLAYYWVSVYFAVNYINPLVTLLVVIFLLVFLYQSREEPNPFYLIAMLFLLILLPFTKLTGLALTPLLLFFTALLYFKKKAWHYLAVIAMFALGLFIKFFSSTGSHRLTNMVLTYSQIPEAFARHGLMDLFLQFKRAYFAVFRFPSNDCLNQLIFGKWLPFVELGFVLITAPLLVFCFYAVWHGFKSKKLFWVLCSAITVLVFGLVLHNVITFSFYVQARHTMIALPALGLLFANAFNKLQKKWLKRIIVISFTVYCIYSFAYSAYTTHYFWKVNHKFEGGYNYIASLRTGNSNCYWSGLGHQERELQCDDKIRVAGGMYAGNLQYLFLIPVFNEHYKAGDLNELGEIFKRYKITHLFVGCYREHFDLSIADFLVDKNMLALVYVDDCVHVFKVLGYDFVSLIEKKDHVIVDPVIASKKSKVKKIVRGVDVCH